MNSLVAPLIVVHLLLIRRTDLIECDGAVVKLVKVGMAGLVDVGSGGSLDLEQSV